MTVIAILPPSLLWAASLSASNDGAKGPLCAIDLRQSKGKIRIAAVDGHRCFRCYVPTGSFFAPEEPIRLNPKAFKAPTKQTAPEAARTAHTVPRSLSRSLAG